ncbi:peptidylprolyl isomerase [Pedobacter sp. Du54]|uniref:peptidylprolyl isomerase n=1 Tax=Pedobacter anseongensis TaxID=3133439 RepID=UPI0030A2DB12
MRFFAFLVVFFLFVTFSSANAQPHTDSYVSISTNLGEMIFKLYKETPNHKANFIDLVKKGYFDTYDFNRVIKGFVIQGGETDSAYAAMEKAGQVVKRLPSEFNVQLFHQKGALAAGRDDNKDKASFLGQFYVVDGKKYTDLQLDALEIRIGNNFHFSAEARKRYKEIGGTPSLDQNYTVFGQLLKGWEVLDRIASQNKDKADRPLVKVKLKVSMLSKRKIRQLL